MVKEEYRYYLLRICFCLLLSGLFACSTDDDPEQSTVYFKEITRSLDLNRSSLLDRVGLTWGDPIALLLPDKQIRTDAIRYRSLSPDGEPLEVSGIVTYPSTGDFRGVVVAQHYSIGADHEAPSSTMALVESALALYGYVVIAPDYIGFGASVNLPQTYLHAESVGQVTADMVFATREYMEAAGRPIGKELYVAGYSQGAYSALAFAKMAQQKYANDFSIRKVFAGGGPYDPVAMFDIFLGSETLAHPATVVLTILGLDYSDRLNLNYSHVFKEPLLSNYADWCISKDYTLGQINQKLGSDRFDSFIHPDIYLAERNDEFNKLYRSMEKNRLTVGWTPAFPLTLVHGKNDRVVPYINAETAYNAFHSAGADVRLIPTDLDHTESAIPFYLLLLQQIAV